MRLVSLCPSLTELVFDLGRGSDLVGITRYCIHPAAKVSSIETVGGTKDPDVLRILELAPDLVLMNDEENRIEDADQLGAGGLRILSSMPRSAPETAAMVREVGQVLGAIEEAERIAGQIEKRTQAAQQEAQGQAQVSFAYFIWKNPWMVAGPDTFASALLTQAGGQNFCKGKDTRYPEIPLSDLSDAEVELVLLCSEPYSFSPSDGDELARETGIPRSSIVLADGEYLSWHGSRTPDGIDHAAQLLRSARERRA